MRTVKLLFTVILLALACAIPVAAAGGTCSWSCSNGWSGSGWASGEGACSDGCHAMCGSYSVNSCRYCADLELQ